MVIVTETRRFITFIDNHTRVCWIYLLKEKSKAKRVFKIFHAMIKALFQTHIQVLWNDNGKEYFNSILGDYLLENGIIHQSNCFDTPQRNGIAKRKSCHLMEVAKAIMFTSRVPKIFWGEVVLMASYLIHRMLTKILGFESLLNHFSKVYPHIKIFSSIPLKKFGCMTFVHIHKQHRTKLDPRTLKCAFVGYSPTQKGYKCYDPISRKIFVSMDVTFFEN